jgi:ABC-type multidrug transport system ATPase subunit
VNQPGGSLLECRGLAAGYGAVAVVRDVDLYVEPGEIVGLIGPNGAGKTTVFHLIAGFHAPAIVQVGSEYAAGFPGVGYAAKIVEELLSLLLFRSPQNAGQL